MIKTKTVEHLNIEAKLKEELIQLEVLNPCDQEYYYDQGDLVIQYRQKMDVFNFVNGLSLALRFQIIGMPYSVSKKGYHGRRENIEDMIEGIKGLKVVLNGDDDLRLPMALTLPTYVFENNFTSFKNYLSKMRSHYRYRIKKALSKGRNLKFNQIEGHEFTEDHYKSYLEVYENSKDKLECLTIDFFRNFPAKLYEVTSDVSQEPMGFIQLVSVDNQMQFLFGGFKRQYNSQYDLYMNMLLKIIAVGIENNVDTIEFGQTASDTKLKIGCHEVTKYLYVHHSNRLLQKLITSVLPLLSNRTGKTNYKVFKD